MFDCVRNMPLGSFLKLRCLVIGTSFPRKRKVLKALRCDAYWWAALKRGRRLLQSDRYYRDFKNLSFFSNKEKKAIISLTFPRLTILLFHCLHTCSMSHLMYSSGRLHHGQISNKHRILSCRTYSDPIVERCGARYRIYIRCIICRKSNQLQQHRKEARFTDVRVTFRSQYKSRMEPLGK